MLLIVPCNLFAQENFTLVQAKEYAIKNAYSIQISSKDIDLAKEKVGEIKAIGLPQVNAELGHQHFLNLPVQIIPNFISPILFPNQPPNPAYIQAKFGTNFSERASITVNQLIFDGTYLLGLEAIKSFVELANGKVKKTELEVKEAVTSTYYLVMILKENEKVLTQAIANLEKTLNEITIIQQKGFLDKTDVEQLQLVVNNQKTIQNALKRQQEVAVSLLKFQMGYPVEKEIQVLDNVQDAIKIALPATPSIETNADYHLLATQLKLQKLNIKKEKKGYYPTVFGYFSHTYTYQGNDFKTIFKKAGWFPTTLWGLGVKIPVFDSFSKKHKQAQARIEVEKLQIVQKQLEEGVKMQQKQAEVEYVNAIEQYKSQQDNLLLAQKIVDKAQIKYKAGVGSSMELTQTQTQYLQTQAQVISAIGALLKAKVSVDKAFQSL